MPEFDYDLAKSIANWFKHGVTLAAARDFWRDPRRKYLPGKFGPIESRHAILAKFQGEIWVAVFALRGGKVRLISARRAKRKERSRYLR